MTSYTYQITQVSMFVVPVLDWHVQWYKWHVYRKHGWAAGIKRVSGGYTPSKLAARKACEWVIRKDRWLS